MKKKNGFTIIETILVVAIGSLLFLMIAIAIPPLSRSQRDNNRKNTMNKLLSEITQYQTNNRKALPSISGADTDGSTIDKILLYYNETTKKYIKNNSATTDWTEFVENYLMEDFEDPNGNKYQLSITTCKNGVATGKTCLNDTEYYNRIDQKETLTEFFKKTFPNDQIVLIVINSKCDIENVTSLPDGRTVSILYRLENGSTFCVNN